MVLKRICNVKKNHNANGALARWLSCLEYHPIYQKAAGVIPVRICA